MNDYNNAFTMNDRGGNIDVDEDIFSSYLNCDEGGKNVNNGNFYYTEGGNVEFSSVEGGNSNVQNNPNKQVSGICIFQPKVNNQSNQMSIDREHPINSNARQENSRQSVNYSSGNLSNVKIGDGNYFNKPNSCHNLAALEKQSGPGITGFKKNKESNRSTKTPSSNGSFTKYKNNSRSCTSLSEKETNTGIPSSGLIFKTIKDNKGGNKILEDDSESGEDDEVDDITFSELDPISLKLHKNRIAAKKSRHKKKLYIQSLEERVRFLEAELENQKKLMEKQNRLEELITQMMIKNKELEDLLYSNKQDPIEKNRIISIKNDFKSYQYEAIDEATKHLMSVIMPLELNIFVNKYLKFTSLTSFNSLDNLFEKIMENEFILREIFKLNSQGNLGYSNKIFSFFDKLKVLIMKTKEVQLELANFDYEI